MIPYAEWLPDQQDLNNPGSTSVLNVRPHANGYLPLPTIEAYSEAVTARPRGAFYARSNDGTVYNYVGDETALYSLSDTSWTDVSRTASAYTCGATDYWEFAKWNEEVIATNFANEMQKITLGGANFADLGGGPPKARHLAVVRNFLVTANTSDATDGEVPNRVRWCAADNNESWTVSASTQADKEDLYGPGGWCQRVFGGEYGVVFQERSVWRMTYAGSPLVFSFDEVQPGRGLLAPGAATQHGDMIFALSQEGFDLLSNGSQSQPIGAQKVDRFVLSDLDTDYLDRVKSAVDILNRHVYWIYPGVDNVSGLPNRVVMFDWSTGRWSYGEVSAHMVYVAATPGLTLEGLDNINSSLDALPLSLDDRAYTGGAPQLAVFDGDSKLGFFTGSPMRAELETMEIQLAKGRRAMINSVRPLIDGGSTAVQVGRRQAQADAVTWSATASVNARGRATLRSNARYHRVRTICTGDWTHAQGVEVGAAETGWR